jgi:hypothetical protein
VTTLQGIIGIAIATGHPNAVAQFLRNAGQLARGGAIDFPDNQSMIWTGDWHNLARMIDEASGMAEPKQSDGRIA